MFTVQCKCTKTLSVSEENCGRQGCCPTCGLLFIIPLPPELSKRQLACPCGNVMEYDIADAGMTAKCTRCPTLFRIPGGTSVGINKELTNEYRRKYAKMVESTPKPMPQMASEISPIYDYVVDEPYSQPFRTTIAVQVSREPFRLNLWVLFGMSFFLCSLALLLFAFKNANTEAFSFEKWKSPLVAVVQDEDDTTPTHAPSIEPKYKPDPVSNPPSSSLNSSDEKRMLIENEDKLRRTGNLIKNGSFESPVVPSSESHVEVQSNRGELPGWMVGRYAVDIIAGEKVQEPAYHGNQYLDLDGTIGAGEVSQSFITQKDVLYELSFLYATSPGTQSIGTVTIVSGEEKLVPTFQIKSAIPNLSSWNWQLFKIEFRGTGQRAKLIFTSLHEMQSKDGLAIDDVCVSPWKP